MSNKAEEISLDTRESFDKESHWFYRLDKFGVETRGIERVLPEERQAYQFSSLKHFIHVFGLWFAACGGLTSMLSFFLPTLIFNLNLRDSLVSGLVSLNIGCLVPAYCSIMGPLSGCRQMISARYLFGFWGVKLVALICVIGFVGWSIVNCILGGEILAATFDVSLEVGIVVISVVALIVSVFGIKVLLRFQMAIAIPVTIANILFYVVVFKKSQFIDDANRMIAEQNLDALTTRGNWLSFFTIGFSVTSTWGGAASDYYVLFPERTPKWKVFWVTFFGISIPTTIVATVGIYCGVIAYGNPEWFNEYNTRGVGAIISASFIPWGNFGKFVVVLLYLSLICNNIVNNYSGAFDFQSIDKKLAFVPRWVYSILITVIVLILSIIGKNSFSTIISNFLPMLGYWISIYIAVILEENLIFRSKKLLHLHSKEFGEDEPDSWTMYNWNVWNQPKRVTYGFAAMGSFAVGAVGAVVGMNQVYWQGPIAIQIGEHGGDVGFFLVIIFTAIIYPPLRFIELKFVGK